VIVQAINRALGGTHLSRGEMAEVIGQIMDGGATQAQIGGLLVALRAKGESVDEIVGAAIAMRSRALPLDCPRREQSIDTCGTGGDASGTFNVSTLAAILIAACGGVVAKHGNRALSSRCGSADVLEVLGIAVDVELGPLTNPANVRHQVVGVFARQWCEPVAAALGALGVRRAAVVHGDGGLDEVAVRGETFVAIWDDGALRTLSLTPAAFGCAETDPAGLAGGDADHNAGVMRRVLAGREVGRGERHEAVLDAAAMTAALGLALLEPGALDLARLPEQAARARTTAVDGSARLVLHKWQEVSRAAPGADLAGLAARTAREFRGME
jgi:anthranilate phosphoribosyltransferase